MGRDFTQCFCPSVRKLHWLSHSHWVNVPTIPRRCHLRPNREKDTRSIYTNYFKIICKLNHMFVAFMIGICRVHLKPNSSALLASLHPIFFSQVAYTYTKFIKMWGAQEQGILGLTEYLFMDFFRPRRTSNIVLAKSIRRQSIAANHATTMLIICLDSMLLITHLRLLPHVSHFYEFGAYR